jgi:TrmH family RNA methyltransferase
MSFKIDDKITSLHNPKVKKTLLLQKHKERAAQNLFVIEGIKEIQKAVKKNYEIDTLFFCRDIILESDIEHSLPTDKIKNIFEITSQVYEKMVYRENSGGIVLWAVPKRHRLEDLKLNKNPLILVMEGIEKPGNIGALYRTADAAGIDAVFISNPKSDLYNPNTIRASLGCIFTVPTALTSGKEAVEFFKNRKIQIISTYLKASVEYHMIDFTKDTAIVMGTEDIGISQMWVDAADQKVIIPMRGEADSMNVSNSAAIIIFEACRQRGFL